MKLVSWNVNGLRACVKKGFMDFFAAENADVYCLQEIKMEREQNETEFGGYYEYWNSANKKGYSGTAVFSRIKPLSVHYGIGVPEHDTEGRVITLEYEELYLVNCYTPNSQNELARLDYRMNWEDAFRGYVRGLNETKPVVICGDLNVAHSEIDLTHPKPNRRNAGFTDEERGKMTELLQNGFVDSFRSVYPDRVKYSWWSYRMNARQKNVGWRIDYFIVSEDIRSKIKDSFIYDEILGSDHCPVGILLEDWDA